jgi:glycosyltransferase involved in cell wall biosynthesis
MRSLYLTYDGLTTMIAQSQVIPYLVAIARSGFPLDVVSFEQPERTPDELHRVESRFGHLPITWMRRRFRSRPPLIAKYVDQADMIGTARKQAAHQNVGAVHSRSYIAGYAGMLAAQRARKPHVFDMRGFWVDQRLEGGRWPQSNLFYRRLYRTWKRREAEMVRTADTVVVLTEAAKQEIERWPSYRGARISVIPCAVDFEMFAMRTPEARLQSRAKLGIRDGEKVLCYLGSLGSVYKLPEMLRYFAQFRGRYPAARMLFVGKHDKSELIRAGREAGIAFTAADFITALGNNTEVPALLAAADVAICFITPTYSSLGVSPTKLGEYLAVGLPVITNAGIGDVVQIVTETDSGHVLTAFDDVAMTNSVKDLDRLMQIPAETIRQRARGWHDLPLAESRYADIYRRLQGQTRS